MRRKWIWVAVLIALLAACSQDSENLPRAYVSFPERIDPQCRNGKARVFDECGDQLALFTAALAKANSEGKTLLVEYGAEWCIWCHVFDAHISGEHGEFRYTYGLPRDPEARHTQKMAEDPSGAQDVQAKALRDFVAANFVVVRIDAQYAPNGKAVLMRTGAIRHYSGGVPYIFTVDGSARFAADFNHETAERRRDTEVNWYRGYDRVDMLRQFTLMRDRARANVATGTGT
ncbi:thioredoxin-related protein [Variovorax sp. SG517]|uniref:DUF255 domain-containing protein n=1 Tax=Variovorax sp. SG517 TaxID=2587117 RepID=UPI00159E9EE2|nr:DUF255 domain-containing protein [Variovorax sp. SG517]NVM89369.1 thioredoxin-related protein [Variovorax sp. SG517]